MEQVYLDAAPIIYVVQQVVPYASSVDERLGAPDTIQIASELTRLECRVKPLRDQDTDLLEDFDEYFEKVVAQIHPLTLDIMERATEIRAQYRFKTPDSIHLAVAQISGCKVFLTNDHRLDRFGDIKIECLT